MKIDAGLVGDLDGDPVFADAIVVEESLGPVGPIRNRPYAIARRSLALIEDDVDGPEENRNFVLVRHVCHEVTSEQAAAQLSLDISQKLVRESGVVLNDAVHLLDWFATAPEFHRAKLKTLRKDLSG